jgi:hypothetical protein
MPPQLAIQSKERETMRLTELATLLAENGAMKIDKLFDLLHHAYATLNGLRNFLTRRTHLFQLDKETTVIRYGKARFSS